MKNGSLQEGQEIRRDFLNENPPDLLPLVADIDGDGDMDVVTGYMSTDTPATSWVQVWINQSKQSAARAVR